MKAINQNDRYINKIIHKYNFLDIFQETMPKYI